MYNNLLSKKSKKAISALLASALVISAAPTSVAEAAVTKTFTLGVGKTATKTVSATIKSVKTSKKAVVAVKKVAAKKYKLTAKKAGKATVTVKYGKKTLKATVKVGATKVTKKDFNASMKVNETQTLKIGTTNGKKDTIQWTTSDANVVSIAKTSTTASAKGNTSVKATAVAAGTAKVTAKSKFTGKKATFAITVAADTAATVAPSTDVTVAPSADVTVAPSTDVTVAPSADTTTAPSATPEINKGISAKVQNQITGYDNVVLVNDNAIVTVSVKDDAGKPLANKTVIMSTNGASPLSKFEVKGNTVAITNEKGEVSFVIGHDVNKAIKINDDDYVGTAKYTATVVGEDKSYAGYVGFAAITTSPLTWTHDIKDEKEDNTDCLVPGTNAADKGYDKHFVSETTTMNGDKLVQYVGAQQVSSAGSTEHKVTFEVTPQIVLPEMGTDNTETKVFEQEVNAVSGTYGTYDTKTATIELKEDMNQLQYATLNFNSVQLSKYTNMTITCYSDLDCEEADIVKTDDGKDFYSIEGELDQKSFSYQIPKGEDDKDVKAVKVIKVEIHSKGQVQTDKNAGFDIKNITGVYNKENEVIGGDPVALSSAKITWEAVTPSYSEIKDLKKADAEKLGIVSGSSFKYQVPVFPYTGNAVIRAYDANGKLEAYYVAPTKRQSATGVENTNDIVLDGKDAYKVTEQEALTSILTGVSQDGNKVTVNSETVGTTTLKGTITIDGLGSSAINAATNTVYTSVQWNPIPTAKDKVQDSDAAIALAGQKMTVYAQLTDKNGNPMAVAGENIEFEANNGTKLKTGQITGDEVISVLDETDTDINGVAKLVVSSATAEQLLNVTAEVANDQYDVVLKVGSAEKASNKIDLYWVNADLAFDNNVKEEKGTKNEGETDNNTIDLLANPTMVGTPWEFGFETKGDTLANGILDGYDVSIEGLKVQTINYEDNRGTYKEVGNGKVSAVSIYDATDRISAKLGADSVGEKVEFTVTKKDKETLKIVSAGEGTPNINAKINVAVDWNVNTTVVDIMTVEGTSIGDNDTTMYIKVTDETGVNPATEKEVEVTTTNKGEVLINEDDKNVSGSSITVKTDKNGIAKVTLQQGIGADGKPAKSSTVTAKVSGTDKIVNKTINWVSAGNDFAALRARMIDTNKLEVTFNNEVYAGSLNVNEFSLTGMVNDKKVTYSIKDASVSGTKVILTVGEALTAGEYTVSVGTYSKDSVDYNLVDDKGQKIKNEGNNKVSFYSTKTATYDVDVTGNVVHVTNVNSPVVTTDSAIYEKIVVTVNGKVVGYTATQVTEDGIAKAYDFALTDVELKKNDVVRVCYMGAMESVTVR